MDRIEALRLFVKLAENGSFSRAARDLNIKQSTASKWVTELEAELGTCLVQRTTRSVHITEDGYRLVSHAKDVLSAFDGMTASFLEQNPEPSGRIKLSLPVVFGRYHVVPAIVEFLRCYANVQMEIVFNDRYVNLVEEGFDLAIRVGVPIDTSARGRKLADSRRILVASPEYLTSNGKPAVPRDLTAHECLVHGEGNAGMIWRFAKEGGVEVPVSVRGRVALNNSEAVLMMARSGLGMALLADWLVETDIKQGTLIPVLEKYHAPPAPIYALLPPGRFTSPAVRALMDHLSKWLVKRDGSNTKVSAQRVHSAQRVRVEDESKGKTLANYVEGTGF
jgi:DNA-binding transcriptional LysR family regulator